eukprot:gene5239-15429_t
MAVLDEEMEVQDEEMELQDEEMEVEDEEMEVEDEEMEVQDDESYVLSRRGRSATALMIKKKHHKHKDDKDDKDDHKKRHSQCAAFDSSDCKSEYNNQQRNRQLGSFYARCRNVCPPNQYCKTQQTNSRPFRARRRQGRFSRSTLPFPLLSKGDATSCSKWAIYVNTITVEDCTLAR